MKGKDLQPRLLYPAKLSFRMEGQIKCFPAKVKLKEFITTKPLLYEMSKGLIQEKKIKTMKCKMTINSQLSTTDQKTKNKYKTKVSKQLEQEQNHRNGDHVESYQWGGRGGRVGEKVQGIRSINGRYKLEGGG